MAQRRPGLFDEGGPQVTPNLCSLLTSAALFLTLYGFGELRTNAQVSGGVGLASGRIVLITPKVPKGALQVKQAPGTPSINATEGMLIRRGYVLTLKGTARATVICSDGKKRDLVPGRQGCPCIEPCKAEVCGIRYNGSTIGATRGSDTATGLFPIIISPRKTLISNLRPTIRWTAVAGMKDGTPYKVTLFAEGMKKIWEREITAATSFAYPSEEPSLLPGQTYKVVVQAGGLSSQQDSSPGLGFLTLTADQQQALIKDEENLKSLELPETQTRFLLANHYAARELYAEALDLLKDLSQTMNEPAILQLFGDSYLMVGLNREAEKKYLAALSLMPIDDLDGRGLAEYSLAQVYENLGNIDQATVRLKAAINAYRRLKDTKTVKRLLNDQKRLGLMRAKGSASKPPQVKAVVR